MLVEIDSSEPLTEEQIRMLKALKDRPVVPDEDNPELTDEELDRLVPAKKHFNERLEKDMEYKISDLIKILEEVKEHEGDLPVMLNNSDYGTLRDLDNQGLGVVYKDPDDNITYEESEDNTKVFYINY